jgi:hypothetical protein
MSKLIVVIDRAHLQTFKDALTAFANELDRTGDPCGDSEACDRLWEQLDALDGLAHSETIEVLKAVGLGRYKGRPQG